MINNLEREDKSVFQLKSFSEMENELMNYQFKMIFYFMIG